MFAMTITMKIRSLVYASALALTTLVSFSLADLPLNGDLFSTETLSSSTDSNLFSDQDPTLAFNDVVDPGDLDPDLDFMLASDCGGGTGALNKLHRRRKGDTQCEIPGEIKIPSIFQPGNPGVEELGTKTKTGSGKCVFPLYTLNLCCEGDLGTLFSVGPPRVWTTIQSCFLSKINPILFFFLLLLLLLHFLQLQLLPLFVIWDS